MARYINEISCLNPGEALFGEIHNYLFSEGYEYINYENEFVFKKGKGLMTGPTFIKVSFSPVSVRIEAWMKFAILPGVYAGELGLTGFVGAAVKGPLKKRVAYIENMIGRYAFNAGVNA